MALLAPEAAWDAVAVGYEHLRGRSAIRAFIEEWLRPYEEFKLEPEELLDLGHGVAFMVVDSTGRLVGGSGFLQLRFAFAGIYDGGRIVSVTGYTDVDEARAAAERLAQERG
jgi:ketosteroid isomerase-like protein